MTWNLALTSDYVFRGITQTLGRVASVGHEIVAVGSQAGTRIPRAQFFVSGDDGRTWTLGAVRDAAGGVPPPGHGAIFVAGAQGAWVGRQAGARPASACRDGVRGPPPRRSD